jgi:hypothetical protein
MVHTDLGQDNYKHVITKICILIAPQNPQYRAIKYLGETRTKRGSSRVVDAHEGNLNGSNGAPPSVNELIELLRAFIAQLRKACDNQSMIYESSAFPTPLMFSAASLAKRI